MREINTAVITGPTGAIGTALCRLLLDNGIKVYAVCRPASKRTANLPDGVKIIDCDLSDLDNLSRIIKTPADVFFHFGWMNTIGEGRNDMFSQNLNVKYALDAVHAAEKLGCKLFIGSGSQAEYGRVNGIITPLTPCFPENGYGMAKLCAGQMCRVECEKLGMDFIWTRILSVYGPYDGESSMISSVIKKLLKKERPSLTSGTQLWDYIYSEDAAEAFFLIAKKGICGKTYIVSSGESRPLKEYIEMLRDSIDSSLPLGFGEVANNNPINLTADISDLKNDTGFYPKTAFAAGIKSTVNFNKSF